MYDENDLLIERMSEYEEELNYDTTQNYALWANRAHKIIQALQGSDVVMLNETTEQQKNQILTELGLQEAAFFTKQWNYDGSAILFNPEKFTLQAKYTSLIFAKQSQVVVAAKLQHIPSGQVVVFVALHLKSGYRDTEQHRVRQFKTALGHVKKEWPDASRLHMVVAGDLNSDYLNEEYSCLVKTIVPKIKNPALRNAASETASETANEATYTLLTTETPTYFHWHKSVFDYILISPGINVLSIHTQKLNKKARAPNKLQGSDHFPVTAELSFM